MLYYIPNYLQGIEMVAKHNGHRKTKLRNVYNNDGHLIQTLKARLNQEIIWKSVLQMFKPSCFRTMFLHTRINISTCFFQKTINISTYKTN